jgi:hypothetical protein
LNFEEDAVDTLTRTRPPCRHCGKRPASRPRGLCWHDYFAPGVKELYPSGADLGVGLTTPTRQPTPTKARQGTPEKLEVLCARVERGEHLFHPEDGE